MLSAELYDRLHPWDGSRFAMDAFYDAQVAAASSVLDVGCGTGNMLCAARRAGHPGRLVGLDPDPQALARATAKAAGLVPGIEWVRGPAADARWSSEFELATMVTHAFQLLLTDDVVRASLAAIRRALVPGGRFVFETRNPAVREWETWSDGEPAEAVDETGRVLRVDYDIDAVTEELVTFTETTIDWLPGTVLHEEQVTLRFLAPSRLDALLTEAGFAVVSRHGDWDRSPFTSASPEIITVAARPF